MTSYEQQQGTSGLRATVFRSVRSMYELLSNRRKFERMPLRGSILLTLKGAVIDRTLYCSSVDISPRGMGIDAPESLDPQMVVTLRSEESGPLRLARVRYCRPNAAGYRIGLEFLRQ